MRLAAIILAVLFISPGALWAQGMRPGIKAQDSSPQQTGKSLTREQQKKRRQKLRVQRRKSRSHQGSKGPAGVPTMPKEKPLRGAPVGAGAR